MTGRPNKPRLPIDPESVEATRDSLEAIAEGSSVAEAAVAGMNDWQAIQAIERMLAVADPQFEDPDVGRLRE